MAFFCIISTGCTHNKVVTKVTPQTQKVEYFKNFEEEKKFMLNEAVKAVKKTGEKPVSWYADKSSFTKDNGHSAFQGYIQCENGKLASVHIQYKMQDTAEENKKLQQMNDEQIARVSSKKINDIVRYKSLPQVYVERARIGRNFIER